MTTSEKFKTLLWTIASTGVYCLGSIAFLMEAIGSVKSDYRDNTKQFLVLALIFAIGFPFIQHKVSRELSSAGYIQASLGIRRSIYLEILLVFAFILYLGQMGQ